MMLNVCSVAKPPLAGSSATCNSRNFIWQDLGNCKKMQGHTMPHLSCPTEWKFCCQPQPAT